MDKVLLIKFAVYSLFIYVQPCKQVCMFVRSAVNVIVV